MIVSHFFDFLTYPESRWEVLFGEFEACGATHLTIAAPEASSTVASVSLMISSV